MRETRLSAAGLREAIDRSGYYPDLVADAVDSALGKEQVSAYVVHHEATFDPAMEVRRHVTVLVLTPACWSATPTSTRRSRGSRSRTPRRPPRPCA